MPIEPLNTLPLQQFFNLVKSAEAGRQKEIRMDINQAKTLALTLGQVMTRLEGDLERYVAEQIEKMQAEQEIIIDLNTGGDWK
jgi:5-bromo-4-chloroindolyl phosphate hydrolysis protein